jgi:predicted nucleic acid-binding protein
VIVLDSSAVVSALLRSGPARQALATEQVHVPHLIDTEVAHALRQLVAARRLASDAAGTLLHRWATLGVVRYGSRGLLARVWELRDNLTAYDATFVALAEALGCALLTADSRLARATGVDCPVTVVPR